MIRQQKGKGWVFYLCTCYVYSFKYIFYHLEGFDIAQADILNEINTFLGFI